MNLITCNSPVASEDAVVLSARVILAHFAGDVIEDATCNNATLPVRVREHFRVGTRALTRHLMPSWPPRRTVAARSSPWELYCLIDYTPAVISVSLLGVSTARVTHGSLGCVTIILSTFKISWMSNRSGRFHRITKNQVRLDMCECDGGSENIWIDFNKTLQTGLWTNDFRLYFFKIE